MDRETATRATSAPAPMTLSLKSFIKIAAVVTKHWTRPNPRNISIIIMRNMKANERVLGNLKQVWNADDNDTRSWAGEAFGIASGDMLSERLISSDAPALANTSHLLGNKLWFQEIKSTWPGSLSWKNFAIILFTYFSVNMGYDLTHSLIFSAIHTHINGVSDTGMRRSITKAACVIWVAFSAFGATLLSACVVAAREHNQGLPLGGPSPMALHLCRLLLVLSKAGMESLNITEKEHLGAKGLSVLKLVGMVHQAVVATLGMALTDHLVQRLIVMEPILKSSPFWRSALPAMLQQMGLRFGIEINHRLWCAIINAISEMSSQTEEGKNMSQS